MCILIHIIIVYYSYMMLYVLMCLCVKKYTDFIFPSYTYSYIYMDIVIEYIR